MEATFTRFGVSKILGSRADRGSYAEEMQPSSPLPDVCLLLSRLNFDSPTLKTAILMLIAQRRDFQFF